MNIFICGQRSFGKAVLLELRRRGHTITGVAPPPQEDDALACAARELGIPITGDCARLTPAQIPEGTELIIAAHSHWYIGGNIMRRAAHGCIGFHPSLLPRHRGVDAVRWAVAMGDAITGGTVYWLDDTVDGGDVLLQTPVFIGRGWDYHRLWREMFPLGVEMLCRAVDMIAAGTAPRVPQDGQFATWEPAYEARRLPRNDGSG